MTNFRTLILALILSVTPAIMGVPSPWTLQSLRVAETALQRATDELKEAQRREHQEKKENLIYHIAKEFNKSEPLVRKIVEEVFQASQAPSLKVPVDPLLVLAVIAQESRFNPSAVGLPGPSVGLMQIHAPSHGNKDWKNVQLNIRKGVSLLSGYSLAPTSSKAKKRAVPRKNSLDSTLVSYNGGPGLAMKLCPSLAGPCRTNYTDKVKSHFREFSIIYHQEA